ncbi:MAG: glycosyltransferase family 4 protein [Enterococcus sp.]
MKVGFFTDTYFPQVSGVATSIKTLKEELEKAGHRVYIFTTTDPNAKYGEEGIVRMPSVPFVSFKDRRVVVRGMWYAYLMARELQLDLIHTHTEFGAGMLGKMVGKKLRIPVIHTYHTMYEDYLHYIAKGKVVRQTHVKYFSRFFVNHTTGVVCPSERVIATLRNYGVTSPMRVIPTGIELDKFVRPDITQEKKHEVRQSLGITDEQLMILSLSRISYEKNIHALIEGFQEVVQRVPHARLVIVGKGPYLAELKKLVQRLALEQVVYFTGEVANDQVAYYYHAADYFVSASSSETQGLTYTEAMAAGTQLVVKGNDYLENLIDDPALGVTYQKDAEFSACLVQFIAAKTPVNSLVLERKMAEISAERFGVTMLAFYQEMLSKYSQIEAAKTHEPSMKKIKVRFSRLKKPSIRN